MPLASYSGGGAQTQPVGMQMMSVPCWAMIGAVSGNQMSQQMRRLIRPILVSKTGYPRFPGVKKSFSSFQGCVLRSLPSGQYLNRFNWLSSMTGAELAADCKIIDSIEAFSNTVTENTCINV